MEITGITWQGESIDDVEILREIPVELLRVLSDLNGFSFSSSVLSECSVALGPGH